MAVKYYGEQFDQNGANYERHYRSNWADIYTSPNGPNLPLPYLPYRRINTTFTALPGSKWNWYRNAKYGPYASATRQMSQVVDTGLKSSLSSNSDIFAIANLNENMRGSAFSLGVTLLEGRQTVQLVGQSAYKLVTAYRHVRRGRFAEAADALAMEPPSRRQKKSMTSQLKRGKDGTANNWLQYRYGWTPLYGEVYNAIDAFSTIASSNNDDVRYVGFDKRSSNSTYYDADNSCAVKTAYTVSARIIDRSTLMMTALGLDNPLLIGWELVPYSFVFDWWIPVGTWLEAMKTPSGFSFNDGCKGYLANRLAYWSEGSPGQWLQGSKWNGGWSLEQPATASYKSDDFGRTVLSGFPTPSSPPSPKKLDEALGITQVADLVALVSQLSPSRR